MTRETTAEKDNTLVMSRTFDATPNELFRAWTNPQQWAQWFAPEPITAPRVETDPRPGGRWVFVMRDQDGQEFVSAGTYIEVVEPERIVYRESSDELPESFRDMINEARGQAPGTPIPEGVATVTFEDAGSGRTKMTFSEKFDSRETRDAWVKMQMVEGLEQGFDQLERLLAMNPAEMNC